MTAPAGYAVASRPMAAPALPRLLAGVRSLRAVSLSEHRAIYPAPPLPGRRPREDLLAAVERSGLAGRGGAWFPTAFKMRVVSQGARRAVVVANGCEGEPASHKDKLLLSCVPHLVIDGALWAAAAVGATEVVIAAERTSTPALFALERALDERRAERAVPVRVAAVPPRYVAGEATALVNWLNGGDAKPTLSPPRTSERGVAGRPTLVDNVETLAHLTQIVRFGPDWYRAVGTPREPGTFVATVSGAVGRPGCIEVPLGGSLAQLFEAVGGTPDGVAGVLVGGYFGSWIRAEEAFGVGLSNEQLGPLRASVGCGAIVVLPPGACGLRETARVLTWLAGESAGQCGPCVHGVAAIAAATRQLCNGTGGRDTLARLHRWAGQVDGRGACSFPDGAVHFLRSALRVFADDVDRHMARGGCTSTVAARFPVPARPDQGLWR